MFFWHSFVRFESCLFFFSHCLLSFARLGGLFYGGMSFFTVDCSFFCTLWELPVFFSHCLLGFSCLDAFFSFSSLSKTKLTGGLARAGAARRRWKSGLWAFGVFLAVEFCGRRITDFFLSGGRFFNGAEAELRRDGVAVFVGPCAFCRFFVWCAPAFYFGFCI